MRLLPLLLLLLLLLLLEWPRRLPLRRPRPPLRERLRRRLLRCLLLERPRPALLRERLRRRRLGEGLRRPPPPLILLAGVPLRLGLSGCVMIWGSCCAESCRRVKTSSMGLPRPRGGACDCMGRVQASWQVSAHW